MIVLLYTIFYVLVCSISNKAQSVIEGVLKLFFTDCLSFDQQANDG